MPISEIPKIVAYKHISLSILPKFILGDSIQLGSFTYFREMEDFRADPTEGLFSKTVDGPMTATMQQALYDMNVFEFGPGINVTFKDVIVDSRATDQLMFCASLEPDYALCARENLAIVEIDLVPFAKALRRMVPSLGGIHIGKVFYERQEREALTDYRPVFDPCLKPKRFEKEKEVRVIFGTPTKTRFIRLRVPEVARHMRLLHLPCHG